MEALLHSPRVIDPILLLVILEVLWYVAYRRRGGAVRGGLLPTLAAGACLLLALRVALAGAAWQWIALCLMAGLVAHLFDLTSRMRGVDSVSGLDAGGQVALPSRWRQADVRQMRRRG